jgi:sortase A
MVKYYTKRKTINKKQLARVFSLLIILSGVLLSAYVFFPLLSWQIFFAPIFASQDINAPIPKSTIVSNSTIGSLISQASQSLSGVDYTNAQNWFPTYKYQRSGTDIPMYTISIPKINVTNAKVSTIDTDLAVHLVNYGGTAIPPQRGNAVVFGHSTLPQLYQDGNYKTVFTFLYKLEVGDEINVNSSNKVFKYKVESITVVDPSNTSVLEQNYDDSFLTLVTCTPPGTIWKRLIIKARIEKT